MGALSTSVELSLLLFVAFASLVSLGVALSALVFKARNWLSIRCNVCGSNMSDEIGNNVLANSFWTLFFVWAGTAVAYTVVVMLGLT